MKRDRLRVPASRRSARPGFVLKPAFLLLSLAALAIALGPACGGRLPTGTGDGETIGTTRQALGSSPQPIITLHSFGGTGDGTTPGFDALLRDSGGNLYGTTEFGGAHANGTLFKITPGGARTVLYSFCATSGCADGAVPVGGVIADSSGNLYGTTVYGGAHGSSTTGGTVFKVTSGGTESVLYSFCGISGCADGENPFSSLVADSSGNLYGTTQSGGANAGGTAFKLTSGGTESVIHSFGASGDGTDVLGALIRDSSGNLYGTTDLGGANGSASAGGTVFKLTTGGTETILHSFCAASGCADGSRPVDALVQDAAGNFYGTTGNGGNSSNTGTVFKVTSGGTESVLYSFCPSSGCADGEGPAATLVRDSAGNLYGTTDAGGAHSQGTVFKIDPSGDETVLYSFCAETSCTDGANPIAGLTIDGSGNLFGTTSAGGANNDGTVFVLPLAAGKQLGCNCSLDDGISVSRPAGACRCWLVGVGRERYGGAAAHAYASSPFTV